MSQIIQKCAMAKIRDKGLSEADITLEQLLRYGRTLESTTQQSLVTSNSAHATSTTAQSVHTVSSRQQQSSGKTSQGASRDYGNHRHHDDRQGQHHPRRSRGGQGTSMNTRQLGGTVVICPTRIDIINSSVPFLAMLSCRRHNHQHDKYEYRRTRPYNVWWPIHDRTDEHMRHT